MASVVAYVDGFNLYHGLHEKFHRRYLWLDLERLVRRLRPDDRIVAVKYFTAHVLDDPDALARQRTYLNALAVHSNGLIDVVHGRYQRKDRTCRRCGSTWPSYEEKETDVNIAVSLAADSANKASDIALIISADSDLCPAIRTARALNSQRGMIAAFPPKRSSFEIRTLVPPRLHDRHGRPAQFAAAGRRDRRGDRDRFSAAGQVALGTPTRTAGRVGIPIRIREAIPPGRA